MDSLVVETSLPHARLDVFLRSQLPQVSRAAIQRLISQGHILVNGLRAKNTQHPHAGDRIEIHWPEVERPEARPEAIALHILHEDADLIVLNKQAGLVAHPSAGHAEHTLVNALLHHCAGELSGIGGVARPGIVHRLDQDTTGCLVAAKNDATHLALAEQFAQRGVEKFYLVLVCGRVSPAAGEIRAAIGRHPNHRQRMAVADGQGRDAWTSYRVVEPLREATLVEARLHTGRTHQIRVHFQHLGFPLVGDAIYGKRFNKRFTDLTGLTAPRQMLHAHKLSFVHPVSGKRMNFLAPVPEDFESTLASLR
ncbi:MAG: RluA family pseudouridine synthase [Verrucomicrobia bacterium]|nr:RluA family pseudouridine synthase [Verrucomicrobiota bacterium]